MDLEIIQKGGLNAVRYALSVQPSIFTEIKLRQKDDTNLQKNFKQVREGKSSDIKIHEDESLRFKDRWCVPVNCDDLKERIMKEGHHSCYSIHPGGDKLYKDLKSRIGGLG